MALTSVSGPNSPSIIAPTLSTATTAMISATPSNFSCASARPCTVTLCINMARTSREWKNKLKTRLLAVACAVLSALQCLFASKQGLARMERANPLLVQTLDVVGAFATAAVSPFLHLIRGHYPHLPQSGWSKSAVLPARRTC